MRLSPRQQHSSSSSRFAAILLGVLITLGLLGTPAHAENADAPPQFVTLHEVDPTIAQEIRYASTHNFTGHQVHGYDAPVCLLTRPAAEALHRAQRQLLHAGYTLKVYDCYRPQRAVDSFVDWSKRLAHQRMKDEFYPRVDKSTLFADGYIAERSGHSRGSTVDLTVAKLPPRPQRPYLPGEPLRPCYAPAEERFPDNGLDMGTGFDCFDTLAHTDDPRVIGTQRANRQLLKKTLEGVGMRNYAGEWWHFTVADEPFPQTYFDFPVSHHAVR